MKTILLTTLLAVSPSFASAAGTSADTTPKAPIVAIQADMPRTDSVVRILPRPTWDVTFAGLPLSTWATAPAPSIAPVPMWTSPAATPAITLFSIRF